MKSEKYPRFIARFPKKKGNMVISWLRKHNFLDIHYRISQNEQYIFAPLIEAVKLEAIQAPSEFINDLEICENSANIFKMVARKKHHKMIREELLSKIPPELHGILPNSFDIIGSVAIIDLNRENLVPLHPYLLDIGNYILESNPNIQTVFEKAGNIQGVYRTRDLNFVCGKNNPITTYKENGCKFRLNVQKIFFTPRLSFERNRIAGMDTNYNTTGAIWDMFCGVGPFFIQIAKKHPHVKVFATDINPEAIEYANENIRLNKINADVNCFTQDVREIHRTPQFFEMKGKVSRIIMNLPEKNLEFIPILPDFIHPNGCLVHIYQFSEKSDPFTDAKQKLSTALLKAGLKLVKIKLQRIVKPYSPALDTTVIDAVISLNTK